MASSVPIGGYFLFRVLIFEGDGRGRFAAVKISPTPTSIKARCSIHQSAIPCWLQPRSPTASRAAGVRTPARQRARILVRACGRIAAMSIRQWCVAVALIAILRHAPGETPLSPDLRWRRDARRCWSPAARLPTGATRWRRWRRSSPINPTTASPASDNPVATTGTPLDNKDLRLPCPAGAVGCLQGRFDAVSLTATIQAISARQRS